MSQHIFVLLEGLVSKFILYVYFLKPNNIRTKTLGNLTNLEDTSRGEYMKGKKKINMMMKSRK